MSELGRMLMETRLSTGISIKEASDDLNIKEVILENIEAGNIGAFKDIFVLKDDLTAYSKYLGLDSVKIIDEFNEYLFEYTSKIPIKEIEKKVKELNAQEDMDVKVNSPYTIPQKKYPKTVYVILYVIIALIIVIVVFWSVRQITTRNNRTTEISYVE